MHPLIAQLLKTIAASDLVSHGLRLRLYCWLGLPASDTYIWSRCYFVGNDLSNVSLGDRTFFNHFCFLENGAAITIGEDSCCGPGVRILTTTHEIGRGDRRVGRGCVRKPVVIEEGCWIGAGATILPGVTIGVGCVIAAGSVVTKDCLANSLYAGVPAQWKKFLDEEEEDGRKVFVGQVRLG